MQQGGPGGPGGPGINPFAAFATQPMQNQPPMHPPPAYNSYDVQTTYQPHAEGTVPAVPSAGPPMPGGAPQTAGPGAVPAVPQAGGASGQPSSSGFRLPFTASTAIPSVFGKIGNKGAGGAGESTGFAQTGPSGRPDDGHFGATHQQQHQQGGQPPVTPQGGAPSQDNRPLLAPDRPQEDYSKYAFYNVRRYRPYFNVDTREVLWRVGNSFIGVFRANFMQVTQERPDLYGPFWICTTLIFVTAVTGNYASYMDFRQQILGQSPPSPPPPAPATNGTVPDASGTPPSPSSSDDVINNQWFTDYTKLGTSAAVFYGYTFILSLILWLGLRYMRAELKLVNMYCVYGYALTIYIPVAFACIIPIEGMRWGLVGGATLISGLFLLMNFRERIMAVGAGKSIPVLLVILALHFGMGLVLKLLFYNY